MLEGIELYTREPSSKEPGRDRAPRYGKRYHLIDARVKRNKNGSGTLRVRFTQPPSEEVQEHVVEIEAAAFRTLREAFTLTRGE